MKITHVKLGEVFFPEVKTIELDEIYLPEKSARLVVGPLDLAGHGKIEQQISLPTTTVALVGDSPRGGSLLIIFGNATQKTAGGEIVVSLPKLDYK